jgi:hemin uptake protein HemP
VAAKSNARRRCPAKPCCAGVALVEIAHNGEVYRLQATRRGKLILTK